MLIYSQLLKKKQLICLILKKTALLTRRCSNFRKTEENKHPLVISKVLCSIQETKFNLTGEFKLCLGVLLR